MGANFAWSHVEGAQSEICWSAKVWRELGQVAANLGASLRAGIIGVAHSDFPSIKLWA